MIIDGKAVAQQIQQEIKAAIDNIKKRKPCLGVIQVGEHPASIIYIKRKIQACANVGMESISRKLAASISQEELIREVEKMNDSPTIDGILVQLPLPAHINPTVITLAIRPDKDIDGFHPINMGKLFIGETDGFVPCTPLGIKVLLERYNIEPTGKHALVIGRSNIVGKPMAALLMQHAPGGNATVTIANRHTYNIKELGRMADIIIAAAGHPKFVTVDMVKEGAVIIDVGINRVDSQIVGDVDFDRVKDKCSYITPVPGGVGPMTIAMLLNNTLRSYKKRIS